MSASHIKRNISGKEFIRSSLWIYLATVVTFAAGLLTTIFLARLLKPELYGVFSVCVAVATLLATFCDLGLNVSASYFSSFFSAKGERKKLVSYISVLLRYKFVLILVVCLIMYIFSDFFAQIFHSPQSVQYFEIAVLYLAFLSLFGFLTSILSGLKKFKKVALTSMLFNLLKLVIAPSLILYGLGVTGALLGFVLAVAISSFVIYLFIRSFISLRPGKIDLKDAFSYSFYAGIAGIFDMVLMWVDSIMIGLLMLPLFVGYYRVAIAIAFATSGLVSMGLRTILMPSFVSMEAIGDRKRLKRYFDEAVKYGMFISIPAVFGLALIARPLIALLFGAEYLSSVPVLMILSYFSLGSMMLIIIASAFAALKQPKMIAQIFIVMAILNVVLNTLLIPHFGIIGAASATVTTWILGLALAAFLLKRKFDISFDIKHLFKPLVASIIMFGALYPLLGYINSIPLGLLFVAAAVLLYLILMYLLHFPIRELFSRIRGALRKS